jgi:hypothetical protein
MLNTIGDSLSAFASNQDSDHQDDDEEDAELGLLSADDKTGWLMGTISKTILHLIVCYLQKQLNLHELR